MNKEIMEIIQEYMDKTLSEGCYIEVWENSCDICSPWEYCGHKRNYEYSRIQEDNTFKVDLDRYTMEDFNEIYTWYKDPTYWCKILGHYDITAVLKCIKSFHWIMCYCFDDWDKFQIYKLADTEGFWYFYIPNKPLHLFSEKENEDLLKLLKQLWTI